VKLLDAFAHPGDSHARRNFRAGLRPAIGGADPIVLDRNEQGIVAALHANGDRGGVGVAMHVGESLLDDAVDSQFEFGIQPTNIAVDSQSHGNTAAV
jgi:hypothetical protein